jgi:S1-C subfamily serine protease
MALLPPFFLNSVTAIGLRTSDTEVSYGATGFLFGKLTREGPEPADRLYHVYLVTNRHVFEDHKSAVLRFNPSAGAPAKTYDLALVDEKGAPLWSLHARAEVDVAAIPINLGLLNKESIEYSFFESDKHILPRKQASEEGISEGDGVFVLGFPLGDVGKERNYVVVRHGIIARIRDAIIGASDYIIIDATVFPGNSGGPVVTQPQAIAIEGTKAQTRSCLIGMVSAYVPYNDIAYSKQTGRARVIFEENTGLALVVPVDHIFEVVNTAHARVMTEAAKSGSA